MSIATPSILLSTRLTAKRFKFRHRTSPLTCFVRHITSRRLEFDKCGDPLKVLHLREHDVPDAPSNDEVIVKMLAAPVNPADINTLQGVYPIKPAGIPPVGGNEGAGEVITVGNSVKSLKVGDWVIPANAGLWGTWATHVIEKEDKFFKIPNDIPILGAATISVNPSSAYRMLLDFVDLKEGDAVIQSGSNSSVGQAVIQLARRRGLKTINIVRERPDLPELKMALQKLGADLVVTDVELRNPTFKEKLAQNSMSPRLGLDCVGGQMATDLLRILEKGATMVTYGGMSRRPLNVTASTLIFRDIRIRGFWMSEWNKHNRGKNDLANKMIEDLCQMLREGKLVIPPIQSVPFDQYRNAIELSMRGMVAEKQVLVF